MQFNLSKLTKNLILLNLIILLVAPQLNNVHYDPLPQFWAEMTFAWATISLFLIICFAFKSLSIPRIIIPLILLVSYLCLQQFFTAIAFSGLSYVAALEFFITILLAISVSTIVSHYGIKTFVTYISIALVIGATLQSIIGLIQYNGWFKYFGGWIFYDSNHPTSNIFGHFGQRNHYCHYLSWASFGLIYLFHTKRIPKVIFFPGLAWFMFSMTIAGSRSVFIYFGLASLIAIGYLLQQQNSTAKKLAALILGATITLILFEYLYPLLQTLIHHNEVSSGLQRLISTGGNGGEAGRRLVEWQKAWLVFKAHPLIGQGFNQFAQQSVYLQPLFPHAPMNDGLFTNCHNLLLQLLAETGLIGTVIVAAGISYAIAAMLKTTTIETIIILCLFATTLAHSMLEYPLWYIYFLGPFIMFLAIDKPLTKLNSNTLAGIATLPMAGLVYLMLSSSFVFNTLVNYIDTPINLSAFQTQAKYLEDLTQRNSLWAYPALYTLDNYIIIDSSNTNKTFSLNDQLDYENKFTNFHPYPDNLIKQALLKWKLGQHAQAKELVELALVAFPAYQSSYLSQLKSKQYKPLYELTKRYHYN